MQQLSVRGVVAISLGAVGGALSRYYLGLWLNRWLGVGFPYGTLIVNLSGCVGMGCFWALVTDKISAIAPEIQMLVAVGFLGSYTTFSTYELDTVNLFRSDQILKAACYWLISSIGGFGALWLGIWLTRRG
ncbi:MAG: fluoride efflux transporter CrcB [Jaaginema sp. PMC 1079.18]|nr:fluoride efflux transporter CrcB [Jaaginema sp. PMC 1080.18]MEC4851613.1 fluoride efflux transporter CrcB [Jaaginema sp. PMC 1079.18]MEC4868046.1 fluoride efflux transporter CrcB [Jaaginema sp. PMC 1078.18]